MKFYLLVQWVTGFKLASRQNSFVFPLLALEKFGRFKVVAIIWSKIFQNNIFDFIREVEEKWVELFSIFCLTETLLQFCWNERNIYPKNIYDFLAVGGKMDEPNGFLFSPLQKLAYNLTSGKCNCGIYIMHIFRNNILDFFRRLGRSGMNEWMIPQYCLLIKYFTNYWNLLIGIEGHMKMFPGRIDLF